MLSRKSQQHTFFNCAYYTDLGTSYTYIYTYSYRSKLQAYFFPFTTYTWNYYYMYLYNLPYTCIFLKVKWTLGI